MKHVTYFLLTLLFFSGNFLLAQEEAQPADTVTTDTTNIKTGTSYFHNDAYHAYTITVYTDDDKYVQKWLTRELKKSGGKTKKKRKGVMVHTTNIPDIHPETEYDIHFKVDPGTDTRSLELSTAFIADGEALSAELDEQTHDRAMDFMREIYQKVNQDIIQGSIEDQQKLVDDLEGRMGSLKKDQEKLEKDLSKAKDALSNAETELRYVEAELTAQKSLIQAKESSDAKELSADDLKALSKLRGDMASLEKEKAKLMEEISNEKVEIENLEAALPKNQEAQEALARKIERERQNLESYRAKLRSIR